MADGQDGIRAEVAGELAGSWFAHPEGRMGHELIAAGLLILAGVTDRGAVAEAVRVGYERGKDKLQGYDPTPTRPARPAWRASAPRLSKATDAAPGPR